MRGVLKGRCITLDCVKKTKKKASASVVKRVALTVGIVSVAVPVILKAPSLLETFSKKPDFKIDVDDENWGPQIIKNEREKGADDHGENEPSGNGSANS